MKRRIFAFMVTLLTAVAAWATTESITTSTTITFDGTTAGTYQGADSSSGLESSFTNYSLAVYGTATGRVITSVEGNVSGTIHGAAYSGSKYLQMISTVAWTTSEFAKRTAGGNNLANQTFAPCIAFNTGVAGTVYVSVQRRGSGNGSLKFAYQTTGTTDTSKFKLATSDDKDFSSDAEVKEYSYEVPEATTVLIRGNMKIYAIRFEPKQAPETVSVFLTAGQSNTAGRCMNENLPDYIKTLGENNDGAYQYCNWSYTNGSTRKGESEGVLRKFWPEMESSNNAGRFAYDAIVYYWIEQALQKDFYVVKHAAGGTSIDPTCTSSNDYHWSADATWLAEHASCNEEGGTSMLKALCSNIGKTLDAIEEAGKTPDIKCMIWHQGESDRTGTGPDGYHDNLQAVVQYVRDYLVEKTGDEKYATLDFICGTVPPQSKQFNKKVYDALFTLASEDSHFHVIKTEPGTFIGDDLHFDTNCAERLGIGMYNKMVDLGLVVGEKQAVPEAILPEQTTITLDFSTWTKDNIEQASTYVNLTAEATSSVTALDGTTPMYKIVGSEASGDFSEFAETFALATPANIQLRGAGHGLFANRKQSLLSLLNLEAGDRVTITTKAGDGGNSLKFVSTNAYKDGDETKAAVTTSTEWVSGESYVVTSATQLDLLFGINTATTSYIYKVVIEKGAVEIEPEATIPVVHMCGDSMMSIYGDESSDESANATYKQGMRGWGQFFQDYFTTESGVIVQDWAHTGTTAKGFYGGANYWNVVMGNSTMTDAYKAERPYVKDFVPVKAGDYVILCWGHNDQKGGSLHNGYKTIMESEYTTYLTTMVNEVKAKGAYPILATSICRALFSGKTLTRLGKIDACEAAGESHSDSDDPFDYPAAMRQLAADLGVPCIDLNAASQTLWEDFGPGLTASVFFEGVGTTHTAEKGARAMGIAANHAILDWDVTTDMYKDYATLKAAMKTGVTQYDKADYASSETVVASETVWTFEKSADGQTTYESGDVITNELLDYNGLYLRGYNSNNHGFKAQGVSGSFTFSNGKQVSWTMGAIASAMSSVPCTDASTAGQAVTTSTDRCIAINTSSAGTFYVAMRTKGDPTDGRYFKMAFNGTEVDSKASSKSVTELKYHAEEAGVFYAWGTEGYIVVAVYYVPDADTSEDEMHEPGSTTSVTIGSQGYSSFSHAEALDFSTVEGLKAYVVSSVNGNGLAVLSSVTEAPGETGLILRGTPNQEYSIPYAATAAAPASNLLVATVTATPVAASTDDVHNYMFANGSKGLGFYYARTATTSAAGKAYLSTGATALSNEAVGSRSFVFDDEGTTGISVMHNSECIMHNEYFDLQGRRIANGQKPTAKGLYIVNGKKVIIK